MGACGVANELPEMSLRFLVDSWLTQGPDAVVAFLIYPRKATTASGPCASQLALIRL